MSTELSKGVVTFIEAIGYVIVPDDDVDAIVRFPREIHPHKDGLWDTTRLPDGYNVADRVEFIMCDDGMFAKTLRKRANS